MVEHNLAKVGVAGSSPVSRSVAAMGRDIGVMIISRKGAAELVAVRDEGG